MLVVFSPQSHRGHRDRSFLGGRYQADTTHQATGRQGTKKFLLPVFPPLSLWLGGENNLTDQHSPKFVGYKKASQPPQAIVGTGASFNFQLIFCNFQFSIATERGNGAWDGSGDPPTTMFWDGLPTAPASASPPNSPRPILNVQRRTEIMKVPRWHRETRPAESTVLEEDTGRASATQERVRCWAG